MPQSELKFIAGLISPDVLQNAEKNPLGMEMAAIKKCSILEIRYDLFNDKDEWENLSQRVSELNSKALRLGTIRLKKDGGAYENERTAERIALFAGKNLHWIDIERGIDLSQAKKIGVKIICSWHLFDRVPSEQELDEFAEECLALKTEGCKVAAMAHSKNDAEPLYSFAKRYAKRFELFAVFAMGEEGKESRLRSLDEGANLTYSAIGNSLAPGQYNLFDHVAYKRVSRIGELN